MRNSKKILGLVLALIALTLVMSISIFAQDTEDVVLPDGVTVDDFGDNTVTDGTNYYATLSAAVTAIDNAKTSGAVLYCKPNADVGVMSHAPVCSTLTVYGNGATVATGGNQDFDIGNTDPNGGKDVTGDMTLTVYNLNGCGAWGTKATEHTVTVVFEGCKDMGEVFINGTVGTLNISLTNCSFTSNVVSNCKVYSNANGNITLNGVEFSNVDKAVNLNHKVAGTQEVVLTNCTFTNCGNNVTAGTDEIPVRVLSSVEGGYSNLTVSGCKFTGTPEGGADILLDYGVGTTTASVSTTAANVTVETENNVGTDTTVSAEETGSFTNAKVVYVAQIGDVKFETLADALANANGETVTLINDVTLDAELTLPAGITINGNGKQINGSIVASGNVTFVGHTKVTSFNAGYNKPVITIGEGACLEMNGTGRMVIGHGATFNITGSIVDAKTADKSTLTPSLMMPGASFTGAGVTFNVTNAYIKTTASYCSSSSSASGTFTFNINNSIWEQFGKLAFEAQSTAATVNFYLNDSVLTTTSHLVFGVSAGEVVIDNSNVNVGTSRQLENRSNMTIKNGSVVNGAVATSSNAINPGTITVENATYAVTGEFSGSGVGVGTIVIKSGANFSAGSVTKANITIDATDMTAGEVVFTANLTNFAGELTVINNDKLEANIVDGKIVLSNKPVAQIGDVQYATLAEAIAALKDGDTLTIFAGEYSEGTIKFPPSLNNVTIKGEEGATLKDMILMASDGNSISYESITFDGIVFDNSKIIVTGWRANGVTLSDWTITNCTFKNISSADTTAAVHFNLAITEAVNGFTFTNNVIDNLTGGNKSGVYIACTGNVTVTDNVINNVAFRPLLIQMADCDGITDSVVISGNTFSNSSVGRLQIYGSEIENADGTYTPSGTDTMNVTITKNIFQGITNNYQVCTWGINPNGGEIVLSHNYFDTEVANDFFWNNETPDEKGLYELGIYPIYTELNEDGTINLDSEYTPVFAVAQIGDVKYETLAEAFANANGGTVVLLDDITIDTETITIADGVSVTLDMNGKTITVVDNKASNVCYELFYIYGELTVTGNGTIKLISNSNDTAWAKSSSIFHNRGGVLTIENGTFEHLGGTCMAFVVDNSGNWYGDATTNIYDGTLTSSYIAIRNRMEQNSHGASGKAILNVEGGKISGTSRAIWAQAASTSLTAPATGAINIFGGEIGLIDTARSEGAVSMTIISGGTVSAFKGEVGELTVTGGTLDNVTILTASGEAADYVINANGTYVLAVAQIGDVKFTSLQEAVDYAIANGGVVTLLNNLTVDSTVVVNGDVVIDLATYTVSLTDANSNCVFNIENGNVTIKNGTVSTTETQAIYAGLDGDTSYAPFVTLENVTLEGAENGLSVFGGANVTLNDKVVIKGGVEALRVWNSAVVTVNDGVTIECTGTKTDENPARAIAVYESARVTVVGGKILGVVDAIAYNDQTPSLTITGGSFSVAPSEYVTENYSIIKDFDNLYVVGVKPTATVNNLGAMVIPGGTYTVWNELGNTTSSSNAADMPLSFVMEYVANESAEAGANSSYADWYADFVISVTGLSVDSFKGTGCYLAGYYGSFGWVKIPIDSLTIENNVNYPVMLAIAGNGQKYDYICSGVEKFQCALYLTPEVLAANPNLKVSLDLCVVDSSAGGEKAAEALKNTDGKYSDYVFESATEDFVKEEFVVNYVAQVGDKQFVSFADAVAYANENGGTIELLENIELDAPVVITGTVIIELNGKTINYDSTTQGEAMITNKGNLTINDEVGTGVINYNYTGAADSTFGKGNYTISNGGTLTVNDGKITIANLRAHAKYPIDNNSTSGDAILVINGGHLYNYNTSAIRQFCNSTTYKNSVTIKGGLIEGYSAIWVQNPGSNTVNGQLTITGGEIKSTAAAYVNGTAELKDVSSKIYFTIDGEGGAWSNDSSVTITGGIINENVYLETEVPASITINEETATFNGYVKLPKVYVAQVGDKQFVSLQEAIDYAATVNGTVTLVDNVTLDGFVTVAKGTTVTLDLAGYTIAGTDTTEKNFGLIYNTGNLTIKDSSANGTGKITLTATNDTGFDRYSSVISNNPGGKLVIESGTIEHLGGHSMAYAIDNLTNGKGTYAETIVNGGTIKSTYRAIRQFLNGVEAQNILTVNGGTIEGTNKAIWFQDPSKNANSGTLTVGESAVINGDIYLTVTAESTEWPVEVSIAASALADGSSVITNANVPEGYELQENNGIIGVVEVTYVAQVGDVKYESLQEAIDYAATVNGTVTLVDNVTLDGFVTIAKGTTVTLDLAGYTITGTDTTEKNFGLIQNNGNLTVDDSSEAKTGKITLNATINSGWNRYSAVISNNPGANLVVNGGTLEHTGGTAMAYGIDNLTNGATTSAVVTINGGTIKSAYIAIRQFLNGVGATNTLTVNGGTLDGANSAIYFQSPNANANTGKLVVGENAVLTNRIYLGITDGATEWPVEISIAASAFTSDVATKVAHDTIPNGYELQENNGIIGVVEVTYVAQIGDVQFATLAEAIAAAVAGDTIVLIDDALIAEMITIPEEANVTIDLNGNTINVAYAEGSTTNHIYAFDNKGTLTITGNGTINARGIFNYGTMTLESGTINAIDGNGGYAVRNYSGATFTMNGGTIATTLEDDNMVNNGGYDATTVRVDEGATFIMNGGTINNICDYTFAIENHGTTTVEDGTVTSVHTTVANYGTITINGGTFTCNGLEGITAHALWASAGTATINGGTFDGKDNYNGFNVDASEGAIVNITGGEFLAVHSGSLYGEGTIAVSGGIFFDAVPSDRCASGYIPTANEDGTYGVVLSPNNVKWYGNAIILGDSLEMTFYAYADKFEEGVTYYARVIKHHLNTCGKADIIEYIPINLETDIRVINGVKLVKVIAKGIAAKEMTCEISCEIFVGEAPVMNAETSTYTENNGTSVSTKFVDSVVNYATWYLGNTNDVQFKTLLVDMLNYGAAAQVHFDHYTQGLANAGLTAEQQALATPVSDNKDDYQYISSSTDNNYYVGTSLTLEDSVYMNFYLKNVAPTQSIVVTFTHHSDRVHLEIYTPEMLASMLTNGSVKITVDDLAPADAKIAVTCSIYEGTVTADTLADSEPIFTAVESIESYCRYNIFDYTGEKEETLREVSKKIVAYSKSAYAYFHK